MFNINDIYNVVGGTIYNYTNIKIDNISIDSKNIDSNALFIPIIGLKHNGNDFILEAIKNGSKATLMSNNYKYKNKIIKYCKKNNIILIIVNNTLNSLHKLAKYNRDKNKLTKVIAITGSNGKTTTKELLYNILKNDYKVLKTEGNLNNHIGLPLTLLKLNNHDICILELGMNHLKEISKLSKICSPDIAIITNIGSAHIGNLGSITNILKAKLEIIDGFKDNSVLILNNNDNLLKEYKNNKIKIMNYYSSTYKIGEYYKLNIELCSLIAKMFNIDNYMDYIANFKGIKMRNEIISINNRLIINDCYNANYESIYNGITNLINNYKDNHKILVIGEIKELGSYSKYYHNLIGQLINSINIDILYVIGNDTKYIVDEIKNKFILIKNYSNIDEIVNDFMLYDDTVIYFKGSRSNKLEIIVNELIDKINIS